MREQVIETIKRELCELYGKDVPQERTDKLAEELSDIVMDENASLSEVFGIIEPFENELNGLDYSKAYYLLSLLINLIPSDYAGAKKLYEFFMYCFDDFNAFAKLMNECKALLSPEQIARLREKGKGCFDENLLKFVDWDDE